MMEGQSNRALLALCWIWIAIVGAYMVWGLINEAGLFGWLAELQLRRSGSYEQKLTFMLPTLLLIFPAAWYLGRHSRRRQALEAAADPEGKARARRERRHAGWAALGGLAALALAGGVYAWSQTVPDGSEPPVPFDAATLGAGPVPEGRVQIRGTVEPAASTGITETGTAGERNTFYVGFRPDGETDKEAPLRLFVERYAGSGPPTMQGFMPEQDGYLTRNGLPPMALRDLQERGLRIAEPHYLLSSGSSGKRDNYYIVASLAGIMGFVLLLAAGITGLRSRAALAKD
jgi:hypothetical protein